jgi:hypothetical protein
MDDFVYPTRRNSDADSQAVLGHTQWPEELFVQNLTRVDRGHRGGHHSSSVMVDDLDIGRSSGCPDKADSPLLVDPDAVPTDTVRLQILQSIPRWNPKVTDDIGRIEHGQLPQGCPLRRDIECLHPLAAPDESGVLVPERLEHRRS